jgi:hypothetical protein
MIYNHGPKPHQEHEQIFQLWKTIFITSFQGRSNVGAMIRRVGTNIYCTCCHKDRYHHKAGQEERICERKWMLDSRIRQNYPSTGMHMVSILKILVCTSKVSKFQQYLLKTNSMLNIINPKTEWNKSYCGVFSQFMKQTLKCELVPQQWEFGAGSKHRSFKIQGKDII